LIACALFGLKTLKNKLSEYIRLVAQGETILVTDGERVVAELVPPRESRSPLLPDALLAEAVREGWITPAFLPPRQPPPNLGVARLKKILAELEADRGDR
jgi:antitoxin (DNA-binding transcriptional repressor) of toxin-antitoxin stability system